MPRYKFHFTDGKSIVPDDGGMNLRNDQAAIGEAYHIARDLRDAPPDEDLSPEASRRPIVAGFSPAAFTRRS
jgi:hypothetical protein